ncbi:glycosyltransferase family 9 protein [Candidatus Aerophobetes bacterium]|nr:glycosyltransferase family 9 protein [Candidatus Aerophobetes bacterium]
MNIFNAPKKVLIVKLNRLGDTVAFLPTIKTIRESWPRSHLVFLTTEIGKELIEGSKLIDEVWVAADRVKTFHSFLSWFKAIKIERFDIAIASSDSSSLVALLFFLSSIPIRVGFTNPKLSFLFNRKIPFSKDTTHTELNLRIVEGLGLSPKYTKPKINISEDDKRNVLQMLSEYGIDKSDRFIVLHVGSNRPSRRWPIERFAEVVNYLVGKYSAKIVCIGGKQEKGLVSSLESIVKRHYIVNMSGKTNIKQLAYLISRAVLFIGHSTGPLQIAYIVGTPTVSLWGASSPIIWGPVWGKEKHICLQANLDCLGCEEAECPKGTLECMNLITVDMVIREVSKLLKKRQLYIRNEDVY